MKIRINWKYCALIVIDLVIAVYLVFAMTSWNKPDETPRLCNKVEINIEDENENGFLKTTEVKTLLERKSLYPLNRRIDGINTREIENILLKTAFVNTAQCYVTTEGHVKLSLTQRTPIVRVKAENGEDYYIDDNGGVMPNTQYTSDMIIVTGALSKQYACKYISLLASTIMADDLWRNQIEQINVLKDKTIEIVPRVGDHIINIGMLPNSRFPEKRNARAGCCDKRPAGVDGCLSCGYDGVWPEVELGRAFPLLYGLPCRRSGLECLSCAAFRQFRSAHLHGREPLFFLGRTADCLR